MNAEERVFWTQRYETWRKQFEGKKKKKVGEVKEKPFKWQVTTLFRISVDYTKAVLLHQAGEQINPSPFARVEENDPRVVSV